MHSLLYTTLFSTIYNWFQQIIASANAVIWTYVLTVMLCACALWFTYKTRFFQFRMLMEMIRVLGESSTPPSSAGQKHISSFQAFAISIASRVGTGNLAGVATAIAIGGPGAVFWMWLIALFGSASAFVESTLAQLYKRQERDTFIGGPAYYMKQGLKQPWMGALFAVLIAITFGFAFNSVQSNTICAAWEVAFGWSPLYMGVGVTFCTLMIIFGGVHRIARVSGLLVPIMAVGYFILAVGIVVMNMDKIPDVLSMIVREAFGWKQAAGGGLSAALMQGMKRGLFSNEAGMGSAPNVAATATVSHPAKQGLIQALGVFTDTLVICSCTAFIVLISGLHANGDKNGIALTQYALENEIGSTGIYFVAFAILLFAFSSIIGNYYYGEANIKYLTRSRTVLTVYRLMVGIMVGIGACITLDFAWGLADLTMALMTICNLIAIVLLGKQAVLLLEDYRKQRKQGIKEPTYHNGQIAGIGHQSDCWQNKEFKERTDV